MLYFMMVLSVISLALAATFAWLYLGARQHNVYLQSVIHRWSIRFEAISQGRPDPDRDLYTTMNAGLDELEPEVVPIYGARTE